MSTQVQRPLLNFSYQVYRPRLEKYVSYQYQVYLFHEKVRANAYDLVINGIEIGGGSIRIHERDLQEKVFETLGFTKEEANNQFGFLLDAFKYGTPPHGGIAFGFDRLCALFSGKESIRDFIAFPKNTSGRDVMINSPSQIDRDQLKELGL